MALDISAMDAIFYLTYLMSGLYVGANTAKFSYLVLSKVFKRKHTPIGQEIVDAIKSGKMTISDTLYSGWGGYWTTRLKDSNFSVMATGHSSYEKPLYVYFDNTNRRKDIIALLSRRDKKIIRKLAFQALKAHTANTSHIEIEKILTEIKAKKATTPTQPATLVV